MRFIKDLPDEIESLENEDTSVVGNENIEDLLKQMNDVIDFSCPVYWNVDDKDYPLKNGIHNI